MSKILTFFLIFSKCMSSKPEDRSFIKIYGTITINDALIIPAYFIILNGNIVSFFIFTNLPLNTGDRVTCSLPENIIMTGSIGNVGFVPDIAFKKINPSIYKSIISLDERSQIIFSHSKALFKKDYTYIA